MPTLSPWLIAGALIVTNVGTYFYAHDAGVNSVKADLADAYAEKLEQFQKDVVQAAKQATADALRDFKDRQKVLDDLALRLTANLGNINAAAQRLSTSLKNSTCVLGPDQRRLLECMRRPESAGCNVSPPT